MPNREITDVADARLFKALAHPLRVDILAKLENRVASPSEIADDLGLPVSNVSYHVQTLLGCGLIRLVGRAQRRGMVAHYYEAVGRIEISTHAWSEVPDAVRKVVVGSLLRQSSDSVNAAAIAGGFDNPDAHVTCRPMALDDEGFTRMSAAVTAFHIRARAIARDSAERVSRSRRAKRVDAELVLMLFGREGVTRT